MPSAYTQNFYHAVFSTQHPASLVTPELEARLYPFIGGIVRDLHCALLAVNGMPDPVHLLIRYRPDLSHSDMLQQIKGRSSKWINETSPRLGCFSWQDGYGGFTVSKSVVPRVEAYIAGQKEHHKRQGFKSEFIELLRRHGIEFDEQAVFERISSALRAEERKGWASRPRGLKPLATLVRPPGEVRYGGAMSTLSTLFSVRCPGCARLESSADGGHHGGLAIP